MIAHASHVVFSFKNASHNILHTFLSLLHVPTNFPSLNEQ